MLKRIRESLSAAPRLVKILGAVAIVAVLAFVSLAVVDRVAEAQFRHGGDRHGGDRHGHGGFTDDHRRHTHGMSGLISSSARYTRDGADKTVRYAVGTPQNVNSAAGTFDILLKDGSGAMSFAMNDDVKLAINGVEDMAGLDGANTVTVREVSESGWTTRLRRGLGLFADSGLVAAEARYESADGVKTVQQWVGTPQNIADGKFELALRDGSATLSFNTDDEIDTLIAGLNADSLVAVAQTTSADGATTLRVLAEDNRSHGRFGMFGKFGDHDGKSHGGNRGMPNF